MKIVTTAQMRTFEQIAMQEIGIPSILLMETAATQCVKYCIRHLKNMSQPKVIIAAGPGNNGGDGLAAARLLSIQGIDVHVIYAGDPYKAKGDAKINLSIVQKLDIPLTIAGGNETNTPYIRQLLDSCDLIIDALFGIGLERSVEGIYQYLIEQINFCKKYVISVDIPSGLHADTGEIMGLAVKANLTVTFGFVKAGLLLGRGGEYSGKIEMAEIGIPENIAAIINTFTLSPAEAALLLPKRFFRSNKGSYGKAAVLAGSASMSGALIMCCHALYRTGCGLVNACTVKQAATVVHNALPEAVTTILPDTDGFCDRQSYEHLRPMLNSGCNVVLAGPGMGCNDHTADFLVQILSHVNTPMVLDADALNIISKNIKLLHQLKQLSVITPHPGEMSRLTGLSVEVILNDTILYARQFAQKYGVVTLLKDARTIIASPDGQICINTTGNSSMSKAGSGDVLTGVIGSLIAQGLPPFEAACLGAYLHGKAGERASQQKGIYGVLASDLIHMLPYVMNDLAAHNKKGTNFSSGCRQNQILSI